MDSQQESSPNTVMDLQQESLPSDKQETPQKLEPPQILQPTPPPAKKIRFVSEVDTTTSKNSKF